MNNCYNEVQKSLIQTPRRWLVTGAAGFIGSHLVENLLNLGQSVTGFDNLSTGKITNLEEVRELVGEEKWGRFTWVEGDLLDLPKLETACRGKDIVLHQAALGSVPRSIRNPLDTHAANVTGFINLLTVAHRVGVRRIIYASSSAVYGDSPDLPKVETRTGRVLSPYAASKMANEIYADAFTQSYGMELIGLRYFNVFGTRQDPSGPYSAVIPKWTASLLDGEKVFINGDGRTSRDFCYILNVVQANLLAGLTDSIEAVNQVYNVAVQQQTTLTQLFCLLSELLQSQIPTLQTMNPEYRNFRSGDVLHSLAEISKIQRLLGYLPTHALREGLKEALPWYIVHQKPAPHFI